MNDQKNTQYLFDRLDIGDLISRFSDAANRKDADAFRALWAQDATWTIGPPVNQVFHGADEIASAFSALLGDRWEFLMQLPTASHVVDITGDQAAGRAYTHELGQAKSGQGNQNISMYADTMARIDGKWLFTAREYRVLYLDETPLAGTGF